MNVTFHTLAGLATAAIISPRITSEDSPRSFARQDLFWLSIGFASGVLTHGLLDYAPHAYPFKSAIDVLVGLVLFCVALSVARRRYRLLLVVCFVGCIFPDVIDLGPAIVNKRTGWSLPVVKIFPWHWREYSGSIYDGSRAVESFLYHLIVAGVCLTLLYAYRRELFHGSWRIGRAGRS